MAATPAHSAEHSGLGRTHRLPPQAPPPRLKLAGKRAFAVLIILAVITGSLAGLTLVYSVDLPQIHDLERYRPSTTTDLYDQKGRVIGSFALERRIVVNYNDFAPYSARPSSPSKTRRSRPTAASISFAFLEP